MLSSGSEESMVRKKAKVIRLVHVEASVGPGVQAPGPYIYRSGSEDVSRRCVVHGGQHRPSFSVNAKMTSKTMVGVRLEW